VRDIATSGASVARSAGAHEGLRAGLRLIVDAAPPKPISARRPVGRMLLVAVVAICCAVLGSGGPARGDLSSQIASSKSQAQQLQDAISAESARIEATENGLAQAQARLATLQTQVRTRRAEVQRVQRQVVAARNRLTRLENRYRVASAALAENLRADYQGDAPDLVTLVLGSQGFADLFERMEFMQRVAKHDAHVLDDTKQTKTEVLGQTAKLGELQVENQRLATDAVKARNSAEAVQTAILAKRAKLLSGRAGKQAELDQVQGELSALKARQARAARAAAAAARAMQRRAADPATGTTGAPSGATGSGTPNPDIATDAGGFAQAPAGAPEAVRLVIAAGNAISGLPYSYGGGHASFQASAYDCSGSISYALAAAGLVSSPLDSTSFESWGEPGPGKYITVYANAGHAYMYVGGWRFDTSALSSGGTRWTQSARSNAGFVARHPPGL
jgi:peptidoglycan hydrolase CwlO-like protein